MDFQEQTTSTFTAIPPDPATKRQPRRGFVGTTATFQYFTTDVAVVAEEDDEYIKTNITTQKNTPSVNHLYTGTTFSLTICQEQTVFFIF